MWSSKLFILELLELKLHAKSHGNSTFIPTWPISTSVSALYASLFCIEVTVFLFARFPFTMLVLQKAVRMVRELPDVMRIAYAFVLVMLCWMALWSFGISGIVAFGIPNGGQWWLLLVSWQVFTILLYKYLVPLLFRCFLITSLVFADFFSQFILDWSCS
jgi:branched-subunit amino acid transport protein AzlD